MCYLLITPTVMIFTLLALILIEFYMDAKDKSFIKFHRFTIHTPSTYLNKLSDRSAKFQLAVYNKFVSWNLPHKCTLLYNASANVCQSVFYVLFPHLRDVDLMHYLDLVLNDPPRELDPDAFKSPEAKPSSERVPPPLHRYHKRQMYTGVESSAAKKLDFGNEVKSPSDNKQDTFEMSNGLPKNVFDATWISGSDMLVNGNDNAPE